MSRVVAAAVLAVLIAAGSFALAAGTRSAGDARCAKVAVSQLFSLCFHVNFEGGSAPLQAELRQRQGPVDTFLISDGASRMPEAALHIENAWQAYEAAERLWRAYDNGQAQVAVASIYGAEDIVAESPELRSLLIDQGGVAILDNADLRCVRALFVYAGQEEGLARASVDSAMASGR